MGPAITEIITTPPTPLNHVVIINIFFIIIHAAPAIDSNDSLEHLNLSWNHLRGKGAIAIGKGLRANVSLKVLDLSWNGFADDGAAAVGESLRENNTLLEIDLSNNRISTKGALRLSEGLKVNDTLKILRYVLRWFNRRFVVSFFHFLSVLFLFFVVSPSIILFF